MHRYHAVVHLVIRYQETRVPAALGAFEWSAGNLHPAKLCLAVLALCKGLGLSLFTHTPATSVTSAGADTGDWLVNTGRGSIRTPIVIHATNAFAATLLPQLGPRITPWRAQAHKVIPTRAYTGPSILTHSYSLRFSLTHFYSIIQRQADGALVLGTSRGIPGMSDVTKDEIKGTTDDTMHNKEIEADALRNFHEVFTDWGEEVQGEGHEFGWTGIIGMVCYCLSYRSKLTLIRSLGRRLMLYRTSVLSLHFLVNLSLQGSMAMVSGLFLAMCMELLLTFSCRNGTYLRVCSWPEQNGPRGCMERYNDARMFRHYRRKIDAYCVDNIPLNCDRLD